jgi:hypothetical protein
MYLQKVISKKSLESLVDVVSVPVPVELVVMVGVAGLDVLLPAMEDWLARQQLREYATDRPDVDGLTERIHIIIHLYIT